MGRNVFLITGFVIGTDLTTFIVGCLLVSGVLHSPSLSYQSDDVRLGENKLSLSADHLLDLAIVPCFSRNSELDISQPSWMQRGSRSETNTSDMSADSRPDLNDYPGMVKLEQILSLGGSLRHHCAATRVSEHWFVTASHCVRSRGTSGRVHDIILISPAQDILTPESVIVPVRHAVCHRAWFSDTGKFDDDIALLYIEETSRLRSVPVVERDNAHAPLRVSAYETAYFGGWGKNGSNRFLTGGPLRIAELGELLLLGDNNGALSPCIGDSGGPLFVRTHRGPEMVGVLSSVSETACPPFGLSVYVRIKAYDDWIDRVIRNCVRKHRFVCSVTSEM
jgi:secreted trypsin-like serine protease